MSISHPDISFHMMSFQAFPHISAVATNTGMSTRLMKLSIPFKSVTSVVYVSVCDGALLKLNWFHHRTSSNITFSAGMSLALDQSGGMTLCVRLSHAFSPAQTRELGLTTVPILKTWPFTVLVVVTLVLTAASLALVSLLVLWWEGYCLIMITVSSCFFCISICCDAYSIEH